ncbi:MAG: efflux RND transporter permease subunit [Planctomycetota bacterium]
MSGSGPTNDKAERAGGIGHARSLTTVFFRNRHLLWLSIAVILIGGLSSAVSLPRLEDPRIVNRGPMIITELPGGSAERVESLVTDPLEIALDEIDDIKNVSSTSRAGVSVISIELSDFVDAQTNAELFAEIRDKVGEVRLDPSVGEPFVDDKRDPAAFTLVIGVSWDSEREPQAGLMGRLADELADRLRGVPGTELVRVYGEPNEEITVTVDRDELAAMGMTASELAQRVAAADTKQPAGVMRTERSDLVIEVAGELDTTGRVAAVPVMDGGDGSITKLGDIATVERGAREPASSIGRVDGRRSVMVAARANASVRVDEWAAAANKVVEAFEAERGGAVRFDRIFEQEVYTTDRLSELIETLLLGALVIVLAIFVIMGLRASLVVASALPLVVCLVLVGWQITGTAVHQMSIFGLIIALGLLIDNAIVVTDEMIANRGRGYGALDSVGRTIRHLAAPLSASTLTTVLAFAPIMLLPGSGGDFVGAIGMSVILAIVASYAVSIGLIASLAAIFAKPTPKQKGRSWLRDGVSPRWLARRYEAALRRVFAAPLAAIALAAGLPLAGFAVAPTLGSAFFPPVDRNMFEVKVWLPSGSSIASTTESAEQIEASLRSLGGVERVTWMIGASHPAVYYNLIMDQDGAGNYAHASVTTSSPEETERLVAQAQALLDRDHPGAQIVVRKFNQGPPVVADIEYRVFGPSVEELQTIGDRLRVALQARPEVLHTQATLERGEPKLFFTPDEASAEIAGLTLAQISQQANDATEGTVEASIIEDLERLPVRVRFDQTLRSDLSALSSTPMVSASSDRWVRASSLGEFELRPELGGITRYNGERTNTIKAYTRMGALPIDVTNAVLDGLEAEGYTLPAGYRIGFGGAAEQSGEANKNLATYAPILVVMMIATLILVFRSVRYAIVLGCVAVFSVGLGLLSTWSMGFPIGFNMILGTLGLIGVALNDSIVVLAALKANPRAREGDLDAIVASVVGSTRHILATTATTVGGFLPLLLLVGGDFWPSLAIVLVGGIIGATLVALLFIPACFVLLNRSKPPVQPVAA